MEQLEQVEVTIGTEPKGTVIWMHGLGADGWDFVPIVKELPLPEGLSLRFIFPHAPMRAVTINGGNVMRAWYDIAMTDIARLPDERGIRESQAQVNALIAREESRGVPADRIVLAGFSQGGAIALQAALRHPKKLAGVMALSTYLTLADTLAAEASTANRDTPILMAHGTQDPVVPLKLATASRDKLVELGWKVEWREYPMPHSVCMEEVEEIAGWLANRFTSRILIA
jgi:phospholipase/carboxylesterase